MEKLELFYAGDVYWKTGTQMSPVYEVGTFRRSDWGFVQIALANGRDVFIRKATDEEQKWVDEKVAEYARSNADKI